jgi:hypothetical protein
VKKIHIAVIALLLAVAAVFGTVAATRTVHLGAASRQAADAAYAARAKQLDAYAASLQRQLTAATKAPAAVGSAPAPAPRIVYHRPPPIVVVKHTHHGDDGGRENAEGGGGDD